MTSYSLHKGAADKTKCDVVVAGVVRTKKGLEAAPGGEGTASAYGRKFRPLLSTVGFEGSRARSWKIPTGGTLRSPLMIFVGLGEAEKLTPEKVRRAAGAAARSVSNAANVALAPPTPDADHVRAVAEGFLLGTYAFTEFKTSKSDDAPGEVVAYRPGPEQGGRDRAGDRAGRRRRHGPHPRLGEHPRATSPRRSSPPR